jgi:hypothetical protein
MPYTINKYNGQELIVLEDGTLDTTTSLGLVGRNYVGYGETQNENFVFLLENFANANPPSRPIEGQIWYNSDTNALSVYTGIDWQVIGNAELSDSPPTSDSVGALWLRTPTNTLHVWDGTEWQFIGPEAVPGYGLTRARSGTLLDTLGTRHPVIFITINNVVIAVGSSADFSIASAEPLEGFTDIAPGITLSSSNVVRGNLRGIADRANRLETARNINEVPFNGTSDITIKSSTTRMLNSGDYILGGNFDGSTSTTWSVDATSANIIGKVVARNSEGGFSAGTITANLVGNVTGNVTAASGISSFDEVRATRFVGATLTGNSFSTTKFQTPRNINGVAFDGTADVTVPADAETLSGIFIKNTVTQSNLTTLGTLVELNVSGEARVGPGQNLKINATTNAPFINTTYDNLKISAGTGLSEDGLVLWNRQKATAEGGSGNSAVVPMNAANHDIGHPNRKWNKVHAQEFKGNADTASLATTTINLQGGANGALPVQASTGVTGYLPIGINGQVLKVAGGTAAWQDFTFEALNPGTYVLFRNNSNVSVPDYTASVETTISVDATSENTANKIVARDANRNFSAGTITASLTGNVIGNVTGNTAGVHTGNVTGNVTGNLTGNVTGNLTGSVTGSASNNVLKVGDTMSGFLTLHAEPTAIRHAATKKYVDDVFAATGNVKAWVVFDGSDGTIISSLRVSSVSRTGAGRYTINIAPGTFANGNFAASGLASDTDHFVTYSGSSATQLFIFTVDNGSGNDSPSTTGGRVTVMMAG